MDERKERGRRWRKEKDGEGKGKDEGRKCRKEKPYKRVTTSRRLVITLNIILKASEVLNFRVIANCTKLQPI